VQVKLWNPLRTRVIPKRFCGGDSLRRGAISSVCTFTFTTRKRPAVLLYVGYSCRSDHWHQSNFPCHFQSIAGRKGISLPSHFFTVDKIFSFFWDEILLKITQLNLFVKCLSSFPSLIAIGLASSWCQVEWRHATLWQMYKQICSYNVGKRTAKEKAETIWCNVIAVYIHIYLLTHLLR